MVKYLQILDSFYILISQLKLIDIPVQCVGQHVRLFYLLRKQPAMSRTSKSIHAVSPDPSLLAYIRVWKKMIALAND